MAMTSGAARGPWSLLFNNDRANRIGDLMLFVWLGGILVFIIWEQIAFLPSRPPTPAELEAQRPQAMAGWTHAQARLTRRTRQPPIELGEVWTVRSGRICGLVNIKQGGVDAMSRFFTVDGEPQLSRDDQRAYVRYWLDCLDTRWIELHAGTQRQGFCGSPLGRQSPLGRLLCTG